MRNCDTDFLNALDALDALDAPEQPLTPGELDRLAAGVFARIDTACAPAAKASAAPAARPAPRRARRRAAAFAAVAAAVCAVSVTAAAVGPALVEMLSGEIGFFSGAQEQSQAENAVDAPRGSYDGYAASLTAYNAPVGESVTDAGITVTLDNISMDASTMDAFFTIQGDGLMEGVVSADDYQPLWGQMAGLSMAMGHCTVDGQALPQSGKLSEFYRVDDDTFKLWHHYILPEVPQGDSVVVSFDSGLILDREGSWSLSVALDGASVRAGAVQAAAGDYQFPEGTLCLKGLTFGPLGGSITASQTTTYSDGSQTGAAATVGLSPAGFAYTDDTGTALCLSSLASLYQGGMGDTETSATTCFNLTAPADGAAAVTLTPVAGLDSAGYETRTITVDELKSGASFATSDLGGFTAKSCTVQGSAITIELEPYGWVGLDSAGGNPDILLPLDDGVPMVTEEVADAASGETVTISHSAVHDVSTDPATGTVTIRYDYYAAGPEEVAAIPGFCYTFTTGLSLDTASALTLPLDPIA